MRPELSKVIDSCIKTVAMQFGLLREEALEHFEDFISLERERADCAETRAARAIQEICQAEGE